MRVSVLDYGAGNVRSLVNALQALGCEVDYVSTAEQIAEARTLIFPGVGAFGRCMEVLTERGFTEALRQYVQADRPYFGICLGMQTLFEGSEESPGVRGLGLIPGVVGRFSSSEGLSVPQIGWNGIRVQHEHPLLKGVSEGEAFYFVHSYRVALDDALGEWPLTQTDYGETYVSAVACGRVTACQFHPEKSGVAGLRILGNFLSDALSVSPSVVLPPSTAIKASGDGKTRYCKRVIACMDVRANDAGDLVVTKGDQYDVREKSGDGEVRNLGKPVALAERYYADGADEITFLNITGFRDFPINDLPMTQLIMEASKKIFVPLTVGGGIRSFTDANGVSYTALQVADAYFRSGADKISIGSDAVDAARGYLASNELRGDTAIETISKVYGRQAVVVSIDPKRRWVASEADANGHSLVNHTVAPDRNLRGPSGETLCWYECTVQGGRAGSDLDVVQVAQAVQALGAGEILLNCIDNDGQNAGYDLPLIRSVRIAVTIPVIASSGAGSADHFAEVFESTPAEAALAASIFHRNQVSIPEVKALLTARGISVRQTQGGT